MKAIKTILGSIRKADQMFTFFEEKDRVMIGVSGGKDSMVLATALIQYSRFNFVNFEIVPAFLDLGFPGTDTREMEEYFRSIGCELKVVDSSDVFKILSQHKKDGKLPCSICSRMKKAAINKVAKDLGCNKVAFAHHADDAIETLLMNQIFGGRFATFQPKMHLDRIGLDFVRPLILAREEEIIRCAKEENIPVFPSNCPNDGKTMRADTKSILKNFYDNYPMSKVNFLTMLLNHEKECLFYEDVYLKVERKDLSLKPVVKVNDALIEQEIREKLNMKSFDKSLKRFVIYRKKNPIGVFSYKINPENSHEIEIKDLALLKDTDKTYKIMFEFIENMLVRETNPLHLIVNEKKHKQYLIERGYKKSNRKLEIELE